MTRKWSLLLLTVIFLLTGCGKREAEETVEAASKQEEETVQYQDTSEVYYYSEEYFPLQLAGLSESCFYFYHEESGEDAEQQWTRRFYRQGFTGGSEPESINLTLENTVHTDFAVAPGEDGRDRIYLLMPELGELYTTYHIAVYDDGGMLQEEISLEEEAFSKGALRKLLPMDDEGFLLLSNEKLFLADKNGKVQKSYACPAGAFQGMTLLPEGGFAVSYYDEEAGITCLTTGDGTEKSLSKGYEMKGDGQQLAAVDGKILFLDTRSVYEMDVETGEVREKFNLEGRNLNTDGIGNIRAQGEEIFLLGYGTAANALKYTVFSPETEEKTETPETEKYDQYGRRYLYVYDCVGAINWDSTVLKEVVDSFNEQSDNYQVVLKDFGFKSESISEEFDPLKIMVAKELPDLIFSEQNSMMTVLEEKGYLEDLVPYLEKSEKLSMEDIVEPVLKVYYQNGKMYGLPRDFNIEVIMGKKSQMGEPGWSFEEFFDWMEAHPDVGGYFNLYQEGIYEMGIDTILAACVDEEKGEADFLGETFRNFVVRLKELNRGREEPVTIEELRNRKRTTEGWFIDNAVAGSLNRGAKEDVDCGEETVFKGYPSLDGKRIVYMNATAALSIFRSCEVKEGAYEFLEYYLMYEGMDVMAMYGIVSKEAHSELFTLKYKLEEGIEKVLNAETLNGEPYKVSREQIDRVLDMFPDVVAKKESNRDIRKIVDEELEPFWEGQKDIDSVCEIIQSRVGMYLSERVK